MKYLTTACLLGATSAIRVQGPPLPNWETWNEQMPSAAGFAQQ